VTAYPPATGEDLSLRSFNYNPTSKHKICAPIEEIAPYLPYSRSGQVAEMSR
jgi:hypothetical protein